jgi:hypothetical protein
MVNVMPRKHSVMGQLRRHLHAGRRRFTKVYAADGTLVGSVSSFVSVMPVPPGKYVIEIGDQKLPLDLAEGQRMEINVR